MDFFWRDTMIVIPWYLVIVAGGLVLGVLVAVVALLGSLFGWTRPRR